MEAVCNCKSLDDSQLNFDKHFETLKETIGVETKQIFMSMLCLGYKMADFTDGGKISLEDLMKMDEKVEIGNKKAKSYNITRYAIVENNNPENVIIK